MSKRILGLFIATLTLGGIRRGELVEGGKVKTEKTIIIITYYLNDILLLG